MKTRPSTEYTAHPYHLWHFYANYYIQAVEMLKDQKKQLIDYKHKAHYWEAQFKQIKSREVEKNKEIEDLKAKLKKREHQLYGSKSEKKAAKSE